MNIKFKNTIIYNQPPTQSDNEGLQKLFKFLPFIIWSPSVLFIDRHILVGVVIGYRLDDLRIEFQGGWYLLHPSRLALSLLV
jgi:hypothetical protein